MDSDLKTILSKIKSSRQRQIQVLSMRGLVIRDHIHELWQYLPNLAVLDLQDALFPDQFWLGLERCKSLDHALAHGALQPSDLKAIHMTVPELKLHLSPMTICVRR
jgi:REP element-mobilizing transposase RayT